MMTNKKFQKSNSREPTTSWQGVEKWYNEAVGAEGHYYHQHLVIPGVLKFFNLTQTSNASVLDLACGQGILARHIPQQLLYTGVDLAPGLIHSAKSYDKNPKHDYYVSDVTKPLPVKKTDFTHTAVILALQNIEHPALVFQNAFNHMVSGGKLMLVLNHPCFRIPRQSSWKVDAENKIQYRRIDRYFSPLKIPIQTNPSKGSQSTNTWSFHYPLSTYSQWLQESGFSILRLDEWCSNKVSEGGAAKMENRAREEFPLFLAICAEKK